MVRYVCAVSVELWGPVAALLPVPSFAEPQSAEEACCFVSYPGCRPWWSAAPFGLGRQPNDMCCRSTSAWDALALGVVPCRQDTSSQRSYREQSARCNDDELCLCNVAPVHDLLPQPSLTAAIHSACVATLRLQCTDTALGTNPPQPCGTSKKQRPTARQREDQTMPVNG